ncbi:DNA replication and repair protein RecF [Candidatus Saccharibacteria bacterium]|nr:DNA replication and repair protein RecF [Candidatus Saccharibacteria bacterium]
MRLKLQNFRKHRNFVVEFKPGVNLITGLNSSGKTSLVEAIYISLQGKSWRSNFLDITNNQTDWWRVDLNINNTEKRIVKFQNNQKTFQLNSKNFKTLSTNNKKQIVLFEPENSRILYSSPKKRREFIDYFISQTQPGYSEIIRKYNRIILQRNKLLKQEFLKQTDLNIWDEQMANLAAEIIAARQIWVKEVNQYISEEYQKVTGANEKIELVYKNHDTAAKILNQLKVNYQKERALGFTSVGPHKDDIGFLINNKKAERQVSRGEGKLIILTIFIILIKKYQIEYVIFDDLFNDIDLERVKKIEKLLDGIPNVFITDCRLLNEKFGNKIVLT